MPYPKMKTKLRTPRHKIKLYFLTQNHFNSPELHVTSQLGHFIHRINKFSSITNAKITQKLLKTLSHEPTTFSPCGKLKTFFWKFSVKIWDRSLKLRKSCFFKKKVIFWPFLTTLSTTQPLHDHLSKNQRWFAPLEYHT
jgi:hypothetical protein